MQINIPIHTVITLIGPTSSGKSYLVSKLLNDLRANYPLLNYHVISSDTIRKELIGNDLPKYSNEMLYASEASFEFLYFKLKKLLSFPLSLKNAVVFIDTTGLNKEFRDQINKISNEFHYNTAAIILDYKDYQDYFKWCGVNEESNRSISKTISKHIKKLRTGALPDIRRKDYSVDRFKVKEVSPNWENVNISITNYENYITSWLPIKLQDGETITYTILPDIHGCYDELLDVLTKTGFYIENGLIKDIGNKRIVCLGDYIDKGPQVKEVINFLHANKDYIYFCLGNHEDFVVKYFSGDIKTELDILQYFDSINWLEGSNELIKLKELHSISKPFLIHPDFICTHAPCKLSKLGKLDKESRKSQVKYKYSFSEDFSSEEEYKQAIEKDLGFVKKQGVNNFPFIFNGHIALQNVCRLGSQVLLDTGVVYGNKLTLCTIRDRQLNFSSSQSKFTYVSTKYLVDVFDEKEHVDLNSLEPKEYKRIKRSLCNTPTVWFAPTMSPSESNDNELEPLSTALNYYKQKGINQLVMQCKFMGSNAVFVWKSNPEECYMTSKSGYLIRVDISPIVNKLHPLILEKFPDASLVVLSGELLPWRVLGEGLIDEHFKPIYLGMKAELDFCIENNFDNAFSSLLEEAKKEFIHDKSNMSKSILRSKYGDAKIEWYENVLKASKYIHANSVELQEVNAYKEELKGYTQSGEVDFQPFQVLKVERGDKIDVLPYNNYQGFILFNSNPILFIDLEINTLEEIQSVYDYWVHNSFNVFGYPKLEGVVIKPLDPHVKDVAPFIKVRNSQYLKLVYGPTYNLEPTHTKLIKSKKVGGKIKSSIKEWNLSLQLLNIHSSKLNINNSKVIDLMMQFVQEEKVVDTLDPRL